MAKYFLSAVFFLAPFPLFFDLARFSFFIKFPKSVMELFLSRPLIPLPNALLALLLYQSIAILKIYKGSVDFQFIWTHNRPFYVGLLSLFSIIVYFMNMNILNILQMVLPLMILIYFAVPTKKEMVTLLTKSYLYGIIVFVPLHLISIYITNDFSFYDVDRFSNFSVIFGMVVYQSLVSYSTMLGLFAIFLLWIYFFGMYRFCNRTLSLLYVFFTIFLAGLGGARMVIADVVIIFSLTFTLLYYRLFLKGRMPLSLLPFMTALLLLQLFFGYSGAFLQSPLERAYIGGAADRIQLMGAALDQIVKNPVEIFFFGTGNIHSYAHNVFLNYILGIGILGSFMIFYLLWRLYKPILMINGSFLTRMDHFTAKLFLYAITCMMLINSTFNASLTQPLYFGNFFIVIMLIISNYSLGNKMHDAEQIGHGKTV